MKYTTRKLGEVLIKAGALTEEQIDQALKEQKGTNKRLGEVLIENGHITERQLISSLVQQLGIKYVDLDNVKVDQTLSKYVPENLAKERKVVPIKKEGQLLTVAVVDPLNYNVIGDITTFSRLQVEAVLAETKKVESKIYELYVSQKAFEAAEELSKIVETLPKDLESNYENSDQPIVRLVNMMIEQAVIAKASDIHIEPHETTMKVRFRVDGHLVPYMQVSSEIIPAVVSRIKFIGGMNIAEKRIPQDGRIKHRSAGQDVDLRISSIPSVFGEKVVIRIATALDLSMQREEIGFLPLNMERFDKIISRDHGIVLITGPTGSGKSTTLYTILREKRRDDINIVTVENPVETIIENITQIDVNPKAGLTFGTALRSMLRQDPDVVMVGEIRDAETAELATGVAITGHLVFSTLHTYDAPSAIIRLVDMGVEPFMVSASLAGVVSQRLIRKICPKCKEAYTATAEEMSVLGVAEDQDPLTLYRGTGCDYCSRTGYKGRTAIHEVMPVSPAISKAIYAADNVDDIRKVAISEGMISLVDNMKMKVRDGTTSFEELLKLYSTQI